MHFSALLQLIASISLGATLPSSLMDPQRQSAEPEIPQTVRQLEHTDKGGQQWVRATLCLMPP
jgi:hypothetical protein